MSDPVLQEGLLSTLYALPKSERLTVPTSKITKVHSRSHATANAHVAQQHSIARPREDRWAARAPNQWWCGTPHQRSPTRLEALPVHDGRTRLVVLLLGDPHLLEGGERREDGAANPNGVLALGRRDDLDLHRGGRERGAH